MAEKKEIHIDNIKKASVLIKDGNFDALIKSGKDFEKQIKSVKLALEEKLKDLETARKEKETAVEAEVVSKVEEKKVEAEVKEVEVKVEVVNAEPVVEEKKEEKSSAPEEIKPAEVEVEKTATTEQKQETEPKRAFVPERPSFIVRREGVPPRPERSERTERFERPNRDERKPFNRDGAPRQQGERREFNKQDGFNRNAKPDFNRQGGKKPQPATFVAPAIIPTTNDKRNFTKKKAGGEKQYEDKHAINKRALIRNQVDIDDFDENKTGYRKFRPAKKEKAKAEVNVIKIEKAVINTEIIPLKVLSEKIGITAAEITKRLFKEGIMKTINDSIDFDTAAFIADDLGIELELKLDKTAEDVLSEGFEGQEDDASMLKKRPPVVTVMGHVDHGKTSLLDRIRKTNVTAGEAGGITQHIGAYQVSVGGEVITFLDTPGHAAFTAMRARGAQATDIAVLVVAADDGIMPQTVEAINHAKAADVPILVAVNKIDKPEANIERIKTQLTEHGLLPEEWGGDAIICPVSAKTGEGFDNLLENINLLAEIKDLKANPDRKAKGVVVEAKLDQSKGPIATILVQNGTLKVSDSVIVGTVTGKIRAMIDDKGRRVTSAGPSTPVSIMGLDEVPNAGDILYAVEHEKLAKLVAEERQNKEKENMLKASQKVTLDDVFNKIAEGEMKILPIIVKADVQGSVEAVKQSLEKLSNAEVKVNVIHSAAGAIKESDIMLAESSNAIIIGFNVRPDSNAKQIAERSGVDIKLYRVIYEAIEDVERALKGMLAPKFTEVYNGKAEVREVFKISGVGQVAGCYVTEGKIIRNGKLRIYRDDVMICEGNVLQLKRFKDDVKEVAQGFECGISIERFNDIKVGDFIESYQVEESKE
ncbi:MAG: translation initiation factor IF-2 [Clostridiales bacterium]|nr:translation initiation factor IF-2 [Clostridiales bacterium]